MAAGLSALPGAGPGGGPVHIYGVVRARKKGRLPDGCTAVAIDGVKAERDET